MFKIKIATNNWQPRFLCIFFLMVLQLIYSQSLQATIWYVDAGKADNSGAGTSWATAKKDLQEAIDAAAAGDQIWVKAGTYYPTKVPSDDAAPAIDRGETFYLKNGVAVYGGFAGTETVLTQRNVRLNTTTLSGDFNGNDVVTSENNTLSFSNNGENAFQVVLSVNDDNTTVLDGFTIKGGNANYDISFGFWIIEGYARNFDRGGALCNINSNPTITNCIFSQNSGYAYAGALYNSNSNPTITNCVFSQNSCINGGGAMYNEGSSPSISKCVFSQNSSFYGGGAMANAINSNPTITNCIFSQNSSMYGGGAMVNVDNSNPTIVNCTFWQNSNPYFESASISGMDSNPIIHNCIFWGDIYNQISQYLYIGNDNVTYNITRIEPFNSPILGTSNIDTDPLFVNASDPDGADNIFGTADDGLRLQCNSPAVNSGTTSGAPTTDMLGIARVGNTDMGAYEYTGNTTTVTLPAAAINASRTVVAYSSTSFGDCSGFIASLQSNGMHAVSGNTTAKVWLEATQPTQFVKRHYEITPDNNATAATGMVTLYFTQAEFDDFNAVNTVKLPTGPTDATGIANLKIEKRSGVSSDGTGLPNTYPAGTPTTIDPDDGNIVWNSALSRWEVSFDVTGFSGFFAKTTSGALPAIFGDLTATITNGQLIVHWNTLTENNVAKYIIEVSKDGNNFTQVGTVLSKATNGLSTENIQYDFSTSYPTTMGLLGISLAFLLLLPSVGRRKLLFNIIAVIALFTMTIASCSKKDVVTSSKNDNKTLYVRVVQVDKAGNQQMSKVITATMK